ncbi:MAG TPA: hypothetical protein VKA60_01260 [Blastocatellia bacterium]|nr:hypothetical protein [Blastocatellia bacterium]
MAILVACSKPAIENPFTYPFIKEIRLERKAGTPYSEYKALYLLTEDFEPQVDSVTDVDSMREGLRFADELSKQYNIPWTHFIDVNVLAPAFIGEDAALASRTREMIADLKTMVARGDDCQLHLHGAMDEQLVAALKQIEKLHGKATCNKSMKAYRQRNSFFFNAFYNQGYRQMVVSLRYGKRLLEQSIYDNKQPVLAFRPGGWDHGSSMQDTRLYYAGLLAAGLRANSGLSIGNFAATNWRVGNGVGHNLASVTVDDKTLIEVSPTAAPGGYVNPVIATNIRELAESAKNKDTLPVIVSVYHLSGLQKTADHAAEAEAQPGPGQQSIEQQRDALERHFQLLAELRAQKIIYPITLRELLALVAGDESK